MSGTEKYFLFSSEAPPRDWGQKFYLILVASKLLHKSCLTSWAQLLSERKYLIIEHDTFEKRLNSLKKKTYHKYKFHNLNIQKGRYNVVTSSSFHQSSSNCKCLVILYFVYSALDINFENESLIYYQLEK